MIQEGDGSACIAGHQMENSLIIYAIKNQINGKFYIGQTVDFKRRIREHFSNNGNGKCPYLSHAISYYGKESNNTRA